MVSLLSKHFKLVVFMCLWLLFSLLSVSWLDPDFGWHYKMGELIVTSGFPETDPFTYTMPSYPYKDYEWLNNVIFYLGYTWFGYAGLAVFYAFIATCTIFVVQLEKKNHFWLLPVLTTTGIIVSLMGIRPQVLSWLLFSLIVWIIYSPKMWNKKKWFYPILMLIWTNVHGSYPLGLFLGGAFIFLSQQRTERESLLIFLTGVGATFVNPYGIDNLKEILKQMSQATLFRQSITEWLPFYSYPQFGFLFVQVLNLILVRQSKLSLPRWYILFYIFLFVSALHSIRLVIYSMLFSVPLTYNVLLHFQKTLTKLQHGRFKLIYLLFTLVAFCIILIEIIGVYHSRSDITYPRKAVEFLSSQSYSGNLFSSFNWGGYLIWKYPQKKLYVDGRMAGFFWEAPPGESSFAFKDYLDLNCNRQDLQKDIEKYSIEFFLWPNPQKTNRKKPNYFIYCRSNKALIEQIRDELKWEKVYEDEISVIYKRPDIVDGI